MDVFKRLKSVFIVNDEEFKKQARKAKGNTDNTNEPEPSTQIEEVATPSLEVEIKHVNAEDVPFDSKFVDILLKAIEKNNLEGFDYLEFKQALQNLKEMQMDDATKYKSALAMAKTMGASSESIVKSGNHYLSILKKEDEKFKVALAQQRKRLSEDKSAGYTNLQNSIKQKQAQIEQLTKEIVAAEQELKVKEKQLQNSAQKIEVTTVQFAKAYEAVADQIVADLQMIQKNS